MPFPLRDIRKKSSQDVRSCAAGDGAICSKNSKIVPYHGANPNTRNGARLRSPSPIMAADYIKMFQHRIFGRGGVGKICHSFALTNMLLYFPNNTSKVICLGNKH